MMRAAMSGIIKQLLAVAGISCAVLLSGCASSGKSLDEESTIAFVNLLEDQAGYYAFSGYSQQSRKYPVDWGIPQLIEDHISQRLTNTIVPIDTGDVEPVNDLLRIRKAVISSQRTPLQNLLISACNKSGADVLLILSSDTVKIKKNSTQNISGYGLLTASEEGGYKRPDSISLGAPEQDDRVVNAFAIPAITAIQCDPVEFLAMSPVYRSPVPLSGFVPPRDLRKLSEDDLELIRQGVMTSLTEPFDPDLPNVLDQMADSVAEFLGQE